MVWKPRTPLSIGWLCGLVSVAILATWGVLDSGSAANAQNRYAQKDRKTPQTGQNVELRAHRIYTRIREFPSADADRDGKVSRSERTGFVVALAMQSSQSVLTEHPKTDHDRDGKLSVREAVELVRRTRARADLDRRAQLELDAAKEEGAGEKRIKELTAERRRASIELSMKSLDLQEWLLDNMSSEPQVSVVAEYVKIIARAERVEFLRKNPEADANGDGILSAEEQQAYNQSRWARRLAEIRDEIEQVLARLEDPDLRPGQIRELEGRLKRLRANEAEYAGAMKTRRGSP